MQVYSIYKATCRVNNKYYIGFDSKWPNRKNSHRTNSVIGCDFLLHKAIRKYGWENFDWEIIYQSKDWKHCLRVMEPYFIGFYDSFANGYNMTLGGEGTLGLIRNDLKLWNQIPKTKENIEKMRLSLSQKWRIIYPNLEEEIIINLKQFCRENHLNQAAMWKVANGIQKQHKNYQCFYV